mgnify:CR=1 FL=1
MQLTIENSSWYSLGLTGVRLECTASLKWSSLDASVLGVSISVPSAADENLRIVSFQRISVGHARALTLAIGPLDFISTLLEGGRHLCNKY